MPNLMIYIERPEHRAYRYEEELAPAYPDIPIEMAATPAEAAAAIGKAEIVLTYGGHLTEALVTAAANVKWIHSLITGLDWLLRVPSLSDDIVVTSTRGIHGPPVSEMALLLMLSLTRGLPLHFRNQQTASWVRHPGGLIANKTVGIFGVGVIAEELAPKLKAMGMTVIGISSDPRRDIQGIDRMESRDDLAAIAPELDFLVLLTPYTPDTHGIVNADVFKAMKQSAYLVNVARGGVVDEDALLGALREGEIAAAGLDTFAAEPLAPEHPFWHMKNVIVTPHNAGLCDVYEDLALPLFRQNLEHYLAGDMSRMINIVDRSLNPPR